MVMKVFFGVFIMFSLVYQWLYDRAFGAEGAYCRSKNTRRLLAKIILFVKIVSYTKQFSAKAIPFSLNQKRQNNQKACQNQVEKIRSKQNQAISSCDHSIL